LEDGMSQSVSEPASAGYPADWLADPRAASDLELALLLVNSHDLLEEPADRLGDLRWLTGALSRAGHADLAGQLVRRDLPRLRRLRDAVRRVFEAADDATAAEVLNPLLEKARAVPLVHVDGARTTLEVGLGKSGVAALEARLPAALAAFVAESGVRRLGVCDSDPCRCVFVDRTRAGTRKYCCGYCNDRRAARAYRRRRSESL
jgi:predicted RNA-binding Zn ribbon-like protein